MEGKNHAKGSGGKVVTVLRILVFGTQFVLYLSVIYLILLTQIWHYSFGLLVLLLSFVMLFCMFFGLIGRMDLFKLVFGTFIMSVGFFLTGVSISLFLQSLISGREDSGLLNIFALLSIAAIYGGFLIGYSKKPSRNMGKG